MKLWKKTYLIGLMWLALLSGFAENLFATHISQPIVEHSQKQYTIGESIAVQGWVEYQQKPFEFKFDSQKETPGTYQLTITSHCLEIHRYACTYKSTTVPIQLTKP